LSKYLTKYKFNINDIINSISNIRNEDRTLIKFVSSLGLKSDSKILDIGCGYGNKSELLRSYGYKVIGVEVNEDIVKANLRAGLECMTVSEFEQSKELYDVMLMSHIIEHFQPNDLLIFMDNFLNRLKSGSYLIIATPLNSPHFYLDFDHIKPYHPIGLDMVFGNRNSQVQYYSHNRIQLEDIWFRRGPLKMLYFRGIYLSKYSKYNKLPSIINVGLAILFRLSFGLIGRTNGWMGLYKKIK
jgi:SAM-dependent methyltransferase